MSDNPHGLVLPPELDPRGRGALPRRRRLARVLSWLAIGTSLSILLVSAAGYALFLKYDGNISRIPFAPGGSRPQRVGKALNFLLVGSDSREGASKDELKRFATEFTPGRRSDTMILVHLAANRKHVTMVSFPRDAWVEIPAFGKRGAHMAKINTAFASGGQNLAAQTVEQLTGIHIDHYIEVNFAGFQRIVDALDGVEVCLTRPAREPLSGINLPAGRQTIRGTQALAFVRQREGVPGGDLGRIERQQQFIGSMVRKAMSKDILLNPARLLKFLDVATQSLQLDDKLSYDSLKDLGLALRGLDPSRVQFLTIPVDRLARRNGQSVVLIDDEKARALFDALRADRAIGEPAPKPGGSAAPANPLTIPPSAIRVTVLNGTQTNRLAAKVAGELRDIGFRIAGTGNAGTSATETLVRYPSARADSARTVAAAIPGAKLTLDDSAQTVTVVLGSNYRSTQRVTVTPRQPTSGAPRPTPSASKPPLTAADNPCA